jgi:hypothetical protein
VVAPLETVCSLEASADLMQWQTLTFTSVAAQPLVLMDQESQAPQRLYRARLDPPNQAYITNYHGWSNSIVLHNGVVEAVIVPAVGRIMQFRFVGDEHGPFWENEKLLGKAPAANSWDTPGSFGGDKTWPAPQSAWNWPPPRAFDSLPVEGSVTSGRVMLVSPVDTRFGLRALRAIELQPGAPVMRVTTTYEKAARGSFATNQASVWVITQVQEAERVFLPVPEGSAFPNGYVNLGSGLPKGWVITNKVASFSRDPNASRKVGNDAGSILWVGTNLCLRIDSSRVAGVPKARYPDGGCSAEVYTNPNPAPYLELEVLGPIERLGLGERTERTSVYTLFRRSSGDVWAEAQHLLE